MNAESLRKATQSEGASTVGPVSVCDVKPCVIVVTGSVEGCGRRNPEPMNRSYRGPRQLSQSCACKKGGKGGARISTWTGGPCPGEEAQPHSRPQGVALYRGGCWGGRSEWRVLCMCVLREVLEGVGGSVS